MPARAIWAGFMAFSVQILGLSEIQLSVEVACQEIIQIFNLDGHLSSTLLYHTLE